MTTKPFKYTPPVKVGDTLKLTIENLGGKGDGISMYKGFAIIIPKTELEKSYTVRIVKVFNKYAFAEVKNGI